MSNPWSDAPPVEPGFYEMKCMETDYEPIPTTVFAQDGILRVRNEYWGGLPLDTYHYNLSDPYWRHVIHR